MSNEFPLDQAEPAEATMPAYNPGIANAVATLLGKLGARPTLRTYVREAMLAPSRRVRSGPGNASGLYPSSKMGVVVQFESRTLELPAIHRVELDPTVQAYFDQAPPLKFKYRIGRRMTSYLQRPDFLVVYTDRIVLVECKPIAALTKRGLECPELYCMRNGRWVCPPAEQAAAELGMTHEIWTDADFPPMVLANLQIVEGYLGDVADSINYQSVRDPLRQAVVATGWCSIQRLLELCPALNIDHVYRAVAGGDLVVDLANSNLATHSSCFVFRDTLLLQAHIESTTAHQDSLKPAPNSSVSLANGAQICWDGIDYKVANFGATDVALQVGSQLQVVNRQALEDLAKSGAVIQSSQSAQAELNEGRALLRVAAPSDVRLALARLQMLQPYLTQGKGSPQSRTLRRLLRQYRIAEARYGIGLVGLLPMTHMCGNRVSRLSQEVHALVEEALCQHYLTSTNKRVKVCFGHLVRRCEEKGLQPPSYAWLCAKVKRINPHALNLARGGSKLAYKHAARIDPTKAAVPAQRPWQLVHLDHTLADVELVCEETGEALGRVWLSLLVDSFSKRVIAASVSFDPPSHRAALMVMRDCVRRHGRLPETVVVDGGSEFRSIGFTRFAAAYQVSIVYRPPAKARNGAPVERQFSTLNTNLFDNMVGNTQLMKNVRQVTQEVNPKNLAVWTYAAFFDVIETFCFQVYNGELKHREIRCTPDHKYHQGMAQCGDRPHRLVRFDHGFLIDTCPSPKRKATARVTADGIKVNYTYFNSPKLQDAYGQDLEVRYDPWSMGHAFVRLERQWVEVFSRHCHLLSVQTERVVQHTTAAWRRGRQLVEKERLTDRKLIEFLDRVAVTEGLLLEQRRANAERRELAKRGLLPNINTGPSPGARATESDEFDGDQAQAILLEVASRQPQLRAMEEF